MSGSVFRRGGQKAEAHGTPSEQQISSEGLNAKLAALQKSWSAPLTASTQSWAVWHAEGCVVEVKLERGSVLQRMGYRKCKKLWLQMEEAVYLMSRGNLVLSALSEAGQQQLLSLHEATEYMVSAGVSVAQYQVYCHLMQAGYIVTRYPAVWVLDDAQDPQQVWAGSRTNSSSTLQQQAPQQAKQLATLPTDAVEGQPQGQRWNLSRESTPLPPAKRLKTAKAASVLAEATGSRPWWPSAWELSALRGATLLERPSNLPRLEVASCVEAGEQSTSSALPALKLFPTVRQAVHQTSLPETLKLIYDVLKPNKQFSKVKPDKPRLTVCLATGSMMPHCKEMRQLQDMVAPLPVHFARVSGGEVSFHSFQTQS